MGNICNKIVDNVTHKWVLLFINFSLEAAIFFKKNLIEVLLQKTSSAKVDR